jgi:hypothetical protein
LQTELIELLIMFPYLNSTLFEIKEIENELCQISDIMADAEIPYYQHTVLKDNRNRRLRGNIKTP